MRFNPLLNLFAKAKILPPAPPVDMPFLLKEDGFYILLEPGGKILLDLGTLQSFLLLQSAFSVLLETGGKILLENSYV
jgi:hypothetical protein